MTGSYALRVGAVSGWIALIGIVAALIVFPTALAGAPPTPATLLDDARVYFRHPEFVAINVLIAVLVGAVAVVPFGLGLRAIFAATGSPRGATFAEIGYLLLIVSVPVYVVSGALAATLASIADGDAGVFAVVFRFYEVLYNGAADVLEGSWIGAFSVAALSGPLPRWIAWLGIAAGLSRWIKALAPVVVVPDAITAMSGALFVAWFVAVVVGLTREARRRAPEITASPAMGTA